MQPEPPPGFEPPDVTVPGDVEARLRKLMAEEERLLTPEQRERLERQAARAAAASLEKKVEVNGILMTRREWKEYMEDCPHEKFSYPGVTLMDGSRMAICERCKFIQHEAIARMIEQGGD